MDTTLIISGGILLGCLLSLSWFAGTDAPYVPTKMIRIKKALKEAGIKKGQIFWELGSGDGRVVMEAAKLGANSFGVEQSLIRVLWSRFQANKLPIQNRPKFIHSDVFKIGFSNADVVFVFLLPKAVERLETILRKDLKKGSTVITQTFHFKKWKPYKRILVSDLKNPNTLLGENKYEGEFWLYQR